MLVRKYRAYTVFLLSCCLVFLLSSCANATSPMNSHSQTVPTVANLANKEFSKQCTQNAANGSQQSANQIVVTVDNSCLLGVSNYAPGLTHSDNSLLGPAGGGNLVADEQVQTLMHGTITYENTHIMGWGAPDPWPDPNSPGPTNWSTLDARLQHAVSVGATPVISLDEAPWWMKGELEPHGETHPLTAEDEWTNTGYGSRILDNKMQDWLKLVQDVAKRYMVAPYNVRYFQVWNELKGYYDPLINAYDFTTSPGQPNGPNARHGYTYMYNQVYNTLTQTAQSLHISPNTIQVGGPYVFMTTWSSSKQSNPSSIKKAYGVLDQRPLDVISYWLQHKVGAGFITIDGSNENRDGVLLADPFVASEIFADTVRWIRSLDPTLYPGSTTLPIWLSEWFASPGKSIVDENYDNAVKSFTMAEFIKAGGAVALSWGGSNNDAADMGFWTRTSGVGGGVPHPWYYSVKELNTYFGKGKVIYPTTVSQPDSVAALATLKKIMLINKTAETLSLKVNGQAETLTPYQVVVVDYKSSK